MDADLRQIVLKGKPIVSDDCGVSSGQYVLMANERTQSQFLADFLGRTAAARAQKFASGREMALALGWGADQQSKYSKYETRTPLPHYLMQQFCMICGVNLEWLVTGKGKGPAWKPVDLDNRPTRAKPRRTKRAA